MSLSSSHTERWIEAFEQLPHPNREVLELLSIAFESIKRTGIVQHLREVGIRDPKGKTLSTLDLGPILEDLLERGLVKMGGYQSVQCIDEIAAHVTRSAVAAGNFQSMAQVIQKNRSALNPNYYSNRLVSFERGWREIRIGVYSHDSSRVERYLQMCREQFPMQMVRMPILATICGVPFHREWFQGLPLSIQALALEEMVWVTLFNFGHIRVLLESIESHWESDDKNAPRLRKLLVIILLFQGELVEAEARLASTREISDAVSLRGWLHFLRGENEEAIYCFEAGLAILRKTTRKRKVFFSDFHGFFYLLALLKTTPPQYERIREFMEIADKQDTLVAIPAYQTIGALVFAQAGQLDYAHVILDLIEHNPHLLGPASEETNIHNLLGPEPQNHLTGFFTMLVRFWIDADSACERDHDLVNILEVARENGYQWAAMEIAGLLSALREQKGIGSDDAGHDEWAIHAADLRARMGVQSILPIIRSQKKWERALDNLVRVGARENKPRAKKTAIRRLVWMVDPDDGYRIKPREQTCSAAGNWSKGRPVALKRLLEKSGSGEMDFLTEQDHRICTAIYRSSDYYGNLIYEIDVDRAILAMVGHPLIFLEGAHKALVEIVKAEPELLVRQKEGRISIGLSGNFDTKGIHIRMETPTRLQVTEITETHERIITVLGRKGLEVPESGKERVLEAVQAVSSLVTVHSGIGGGAENIPEVPTDPRPHIHLLPMGDGLKVNLLVRPFADDGPYFQPGHGGETIIAEINGKRCQTHRNLQEEKTLAQSVIDDCPTFLHTDGDFFSDANEWVIDQQEQCLELLLELQALTDRVVVEWPDGERFKVRRAISTDSLRVKVRKDNDWFAVSGEVTVDESLAMDMARLLELARGNRGRFLPMGEGEFIALTDVFRRRLAEIDAFSEKTAKGQRFHGLAGLLLEELAEDAGAFDADNHWKKHIQHIRAAQDIQPQVPSTLQAELRDYQVQGFQWLARLAAWGVGGCLADDMGLGKTLQAMTLILDRAAQGPSLVVAPTSVCFNWESEIVRFAPTLRALPFGGSQRQEILDALKPFDVVISSYGLLQQESDMLAKVPWNVIILDEAQAIKNRMTKRSQAAMALSGAFRMIATGTPIENHLGELWNLFRFLNPGLLGSLEKFNQRFAIPVERYGEKAVGKQLRKLIAPFILRRTKAQVLEELPARTEIVLHVEMSPEEATFYETLRQQALWQIEETTGPIEQKNFRILAELMRLRRACCNSRLVAPDSVIPSTKLALFFEVLDELLQNHHKALVFSQFVDHLAIIRESLDKKGVRYQYLDGATPAKERKQRVDAFQKGEGDVFLISLKAGGLGINLTAADYVIHMDPWWNPAVEDQASDRAHRIGQQRPVTIYRLVTKNTIEEKIVNLHRHKRDLADDLLEGGEMSGKMSAQELLQLIREVE
uniref:Superfamily II DNA or RNA helicase, SNF2 family n=1 Tax=Candidatus Kentrum sp. MB TaxID=2138164 RepID=A0A450XKZ3_9GAMM|nr:MAG: Superfamily II DNA or RNA helicase, SNF2 family [Candidatus Kentron sp. MB]